MALDRLVGAVGLTAFVLISGATLPPQLLVAAVGIALALIVALLIHRRGPACWLLVPCLRPCRDQGALLSMGYQLTIMGLLIGTVCR